MALLLGASNTGQAVEYKELYFNRDNVQGGVGCDHNLNTAAKEGWRFKGMGSPGTGLVIILERPVP